jgi:hypothetical protein
MKNIFVLPTENSSRLSYNKDGVLELHRLQWRKGTQYVYITSDEEIKEGDWYLIEFNGLKITQCTSTEELISIEGRNDCKKIILTTDQDLIADGVQPIDDEFLEWFVKNPSCEFVEVYNIKSVGYPYDEYSIIVPEEEPTMVDKLKEQVQKDWEESCKATEGINSPTVDELIEAQKSFNKQETLEEAFDRIYKSMDFTEFCFTFFKLGAKWQEEQDGKKYSEEDLERAFTEGFNSRYRMEDGVESRHKFIEQFKKK